MTMRVLYHNNCFDGACSASVFTRFHRACIGIADAYEYGGLQHKAGGGLHASDLTGDENAVVDFKFVASPKLTWWFDHHVSAFETDELRREFDAEQRRAGEASRYFFDPAYVSCTGWIAHVARTRFGFDTAGLEDLLHWADVIDGALFESAEAAVMLAAPAMQLATVIESTSDPTFIPRLIPLLTAQPLVDTLQETFVQEALLPRLEKQQADITLLRSRVNAEQGVIFFDISDQPTEGYSKFIPYYLLPGAVYAVGISQSSFRVKISVGTSPWTTVAKERLADISKICERFGGGGHPRVGAISLPKGELQEARRIALIVTEELRALGQWNETPERVLRA